MKNREYIVIVILLFSLFYNGKYSFAISKKEIKKIKRYVKKANKGYFTEFGKIITFINNTEDLQTKLKLVKWLQTVIKHPFFKNSVKDLSAKVLEKYIKQDFYRFIMSNKVCVINQQQAEIMNLYHDRKYNKYFITLRFLSLPNPPHIYCPLTNIYIMDEVLWVSYDNNLNSLAAIIYRYQGKIYFYINGKIQVTKYTNIYNVYFNNDHARYAFLFEDKKGRGININGKEYRIKGRCFNFYTDKTLTQWALVCRSKKFENKVFVKYKNYKKFLFNKIDAVYLEGEAMFYTAYSHIKGKGDLSDKTFLFIIINSRVHKRYYKPPNKTLYINIKDVTSYGQAGNRWIYVLSIFYSGGYSHKVVDTTNTIKIDVSNSHYIIHPLYGIVFHLSKKADGKCGLFKNQQLVLTLVDELICTTYYTPPNYYLYPSFTLLPDNKKYVVLTYISHQLSTTHLIFLGKKKIKKYRFKDKILGSPYFIKKGNEYLFHLYNYTAQNHTCFKFGNFRLLKIPQKLCEMPNQSNQTTRLTPSYIGNGEKKQYIIGKSFKRRLHNIWSFNDTALIKNILFLMGSQYFNSNYFSFLVVSLNDFLEVTFTFSYNTLYFNRSENEIFFVYGGGLYIIPLREWVKKYLYKVRILCQLQKKLCSTE